MSNKLIKALKYLEQCIDVSDMKDPNGKDFYNIYFPYTITETIAELEEKETRICKNCGSYDEANEYGGYCEERDCSFWVMGTDYCNRFFKLKEVQDDK